MISALEALERLQNGNRRFVTDAQGFRGVECEVRRSELLAGQEPFAVILGCSDSRAPAEIVFDQDLGDLFVIRVAGNIAASSQIGSVEFAVREFGTRLVVVLGHSCCGAVQATLEGLRRSSDSPLQAFGAIVDRIRPAVEGLLATELRHEPEALLRHAVRANVCASVERLRHGSDLLERATAEQGLSVVGAEYSLQTGVVDFFEGVPTNG